MNRPFSPPGEAEAGIVGDAGIDDGNQWRQPVFLHSSFRTCSTWLWVKFREAEGTIAFNEYFNPIIGDLTEEFAATHGPESWLSFHPHTAPYFLEFIPLLATPVGVRSFVPGLAMDRFIPEGGIEGCLSPAETRYVASLIKHACRQGKTPVLSCTRTLGRVSALKKAFGGYHVFLYRNLFHQWKSYLRQYEMGADYFISTLMETMQRSSHDRFIDHVRKYFLFRCADLAFPLVERHGDDVFVVFMALHLYLSIVAFPPADLRIDANRMAAADYRAAIEREVREKTRLAIDLSDAHVASQRTRINLCSPGLAWRAIQDLFTRAVSYARVDARTEEFGWRLLVEARLAQEADHPGGDARSTEGRAPGDHV